MNSKRFEELKNMNIGSLMTEVAGLRNEFFNLKANMAVGKEKNLKKSGWVRLDLARVMTLINQKKGGNN